MTHSGCIVRNYFLTTLLMVGLKIPVRSAEPPVLLQTSPLGKAIVTLPGAELCILYMASGSHCASIRSSDGGVTWSEPRVEFEFRDPAGVPVVLAGTGREISTPSCWCCGAAAGSGC